MPVSTLSNFILDILDSALWQRLISEDVFFEGFCWGLFVALAIGTVSRFGLYLWGKITNPIRAFFKATKEPATNPGPSAADRFWGCIGSVLLLILTLFGIVACMGIS